MDSSDSDSEDDDNEMPDLDKIDDDDMEQQAKRHLLQPNRRNAEDSYEKKPKNLEPLPIENNPKYPQENKMYFAKRCYIRLDRYELHEFIFQDAPIPTVMQAFK